MAATASFRRVVVVTCLALVLLGVPSAVAESKDDSGSSTGGASKPEFHEFAIIGAGPAGLQLAYHLSRAKRDYIVLDRAEQAGSFYTKYPVHRQLISINKLATGSDDYEFNLRHDWNSLLVDEDDPRGQLLFSNYSREFMPHADDYVRYLNDYRERYNISVTFGRTVARVDRRQARTGNFIITTVPTAAGNEALQAAALGKSATGRKSYSARFLIMATGTPIPRYPRSAVGIEHTEGYEDFDPATSYEKFLGKRVLILGASNSAFELANNITGVTNIIEMCSRSGVKFSWQTHYAGDVRSINAAFLDTYQLKSQHYITQCTVDNDFTFVKMPDGTIEVDLPLSIAPEMENWNILNSKAQGLNIHKRFSYDHVIRALGFQWDKSIFEGSIKPEEDDVGKYPRMSANFESINVPGLFFAGTLMSGRDARRSSMFAVHGFRYGVRALARFLENQQKDVPWPSEFIENDPADLASAVIDRVQYSSGLYQLFGTMCEVRF